MVDASNVDNVQAGLGLALGLGSGVLLGSFALPMKRIRQWNWENIWTMFSFWALIVLPWALAWWTVPQLLEVIGQAESTTLLKVFLFGAGWGVANVGFGVGLRLLGMALGMAIVLGLNVALGSLLPILVEQPKGDAKSAVTGIITAVAVMIVGIIVCALAGAVKEKALRKADSSVAQTDQRQFGKGLTVCLIAGFFGAMFNFAVVAGQPLNYQAVVLGANPLYAPNVIWCIMLPGGFAVTIAYCAYLKSANRSWKCYSAPGSGINWIFTFVMGLAWFAGVVLFGVAVTKLGPYGPSIGWSIIQAMAVTSGNVWGLVTGEWKGAPRRAVGLMAVGVGLLLAGIVIIGCYK
jgi:L-rhamnose-H+ transport protein